MSSPTLSALETVPLLVARRILLLLPPSSLPAVLRASRTLRDLFTLHEGDLTFAFRHILNHCGRDMPTVPLIFGEPKNKKIPLNPWYDIPFRALPDVYAVACLVETLLRFRCEGKCYCNNPASLSVVLPDIDGKMYMLRPHRPLDWAERVMTKAIHVIDLEKEYQIHASVQVAVLLDSVPMLKYILKSLFPATARRAPRGPGGAKIWTASLKDELGFFGRDLSWWIADIAFQAVVMESHQALDFALHHPTHPVAYTLSDGRRTLLHAACQHANLAAVDRLLGYPLPLPPRPPGAPTCAPSCPFKPNPIAPAPDRTPCRVTRRNPIPTLWDHNGTGHPPMQNLIMGYEGDPAPAIDHLVARGASVHPIPSPCDCGAGPLHFAATAHNMCAIKRLVKHGAAATANVSIGWLGEKECTVLHMLTECAGSGECVALLLANGAERDHGDAEGRTPLWHARRAGNVEVMRVLAKHGAKTVITKGEGRRKMRISEEMLAWLLR
ncbi:hypothetical protein HDU96_009993 [Phlyctochytrium bullatum]|nr:hypothetical protein HDU96_009993 [Phlyctochytrium bullatum]